MRELGLDERAFELSAHDVQERFAWALRQGNPRWLWPDAPVSEWQDSLGAIERIVREILTTGGAKELLAGDPLAISIAGLTSGMGPLLASWLAEARFATNPAIGAMLGLHLAHNRVRMAKMADRAIGVVHSLHEAGIEVVVLKGMHTAFSHFRDPGTRPLSDIDLLVRHCDAERAANALTRAGFDLEAACKNPPQQNWVPKTRREPRTLIFVHWDDPWMVDLQFSLNRYSTTEAPLIELDKVIGSGSLRPWSLSPAAKELGQPALFLELAVHAGCPLGSLSLLRMVELVLVARKDTRSGALRWHEFVAAAKRSNALGSVYPALLMCERLVPGTIPNALLDTCRRDTPAKVRHFIEPLSPSKAQGIDRCSLRERFMWTPSAGAKLRQIAHDILPPKTSILQLAEIYRMRAWRLARRTLTW